MKAILRKLATLTALIAIMLGTTMTVTGCKSDKSAEDTVKDAAEEAGDAAEEAADDLEDAADDM